MNKAILIGHVCADPEAHTTQSGIARSTFRIGVQRKFKNAEGKYDSDFFNIVAWRNTADFCNKYLAKGRRVAVEGRIENRSYETDDGQKRYVTEIIADSVEALSSSGNNDPGPTPPPSNRKVDPESPSGEGFTEVDDDELPF